MKSNFIYRGSKSLVFAIPPLLLLPASSRAQFSYTTNNDRSASPLSAPAWPPVSTNILTGGSSYFSNPQWTNHPTRFHRLRSP